MHTGRQSEIYFFEKFTTPFEFRKSNKIHVAAKSNKGSTISFVDPLRAEVEPRGGLGFGAAKAL